MILLIMACIFAVFSAFCLFCMWKSNFESCFFTSIVGSACMLVAAVLMGFYYG